MSTGKVTFQEIRQESERIGASRADESHMISTVDFSLEVDGRTYPMSAVMRRPYGTRENEPIEVETPTGEYHGNWNHNQFRDAVEDYYKRMVRGSVRAGPGANITMRNNPFIAPCSYTIEIPD